ncbi:hypothetical protein [Peribacillus frigoritolerans]
MENTVALCPNCHRKMHLVNSSSDVIKLKNKNLINDDRGGIYGVR